MSEYTVIVSAAADRMLVSHIAFLARVSRPAAERLYQDFSELVSQLKENPFMFPFEEDYILPTHFYRKALFARRYKAIFKVVDHTVYLNAVVDCRRRR